MHNAGRFESETSASEALGRIDEPTFALDEDEALTYVNTSATELLGGEAATRLGEPVWERLDDRLGSTTVARLRRASEANDAAQFRAYADAVSTWFRVSAFPSETGVTVRLSEVSNHDTALLAEAADAAMDGIAILDANGDYVYMNRSHAEVFDFEPSDLMGSSWQRLYDDPERERIEREVFPRLNREGEWRGETVGRRRDGSAVHQDVSLSFLQDGSLICTNRDVSERHRRERELERQRTRLRALFDNSPDGIIVHDAAGAVLDANRTECESLGVDREALLSMNVAEFEVGFDGEELREMWAEMDEGDLLKVEGEHLRSSGEAFPVEVWVNKAVLGGTERYIALSRDITEQKARERELERTREFIERAQESASIGGWEVDLVADTLRWTDEVYRIHGLSPAVNVTLEDGFDFYHPEDRATIDAAFDRLVADGEPYDLELRIVTADDRVRWVRAVGEPQVDADGTVTAAVGVFQDVTDRRAREQELHELSERLDLAIEGADLGVWDWDMTTDAVTFNDRWATMLGLSPDEIEPHLDTWEKRVKPEDMPDVEANLEAHIAGETAMYDCEHRMRTADGGWKWIRDAGKVVERDADGTPTRAVGIHLDITARKEYEESVERAREELRQVIDLVPDLIFVKDADGAYLLANEATADAYGLTPAETEGRSEREIIPDNDQSDDFRSDDRRVIASGEPLEIPEEELTTADGETRLLRTTKIPFTVAGSDEDAVLGYARDITDLRRYERRLESQRDTLAVLNQIVRHDIRNGLQIVTGNAELLADHVDDDGAPFLASLRNAAAEAIEITTSAREVTEVLMQAETELSPVSLTSVLTRRIDGLRSGEQRVRVTREGRSEEGPVLADDMLESVFRNLLRNAMVHNEAEVPEIRVSTTARSDTIRVAVADNGPGISDGRKEAIFEEGVQGIDSDGTGLGLYLVRTLVDRYDGEVWVEDNDRGGATFVVELPRAGGPAFDR